MSKPRCISKKRPWLALAAVGFVQACSPATHAAVLGGGSGGALLGQPLDFSVAVRLGADEAAAAECFAAEVQVGDRRLLMSELRVWVEPEGAASARVRVQTVAAIDEPLVWVTLSAACGSPSRSAKRYLVLANPLNAAGGEAAPLTPAAAAVATLSPQLETGTLSERSNTTLARRSAQRASGSALTAAAIALPGSAWRPVALRGSAVAVAGRTARRTAPRQHVQAVAAAPKPLSPRLRRPAAPGLPRLRLDAAAPMLAAGGAVEQAMQAVAQATAMARQAASAASAAADRIAALERTVDQLRADAQNSRSQAALLRDQLAQSGSPASTWLLGGLALALSLLAGWLTMQLAAARRALSFGWKGVTAEARQASSVDGAEQRPPTAVMAFVHSEVDATSMTAPRTRPAPAWPPPAPVDEWLPSVPAGGKAVRDEPALAPNPVSGPLRRLAGGVPLAAAQAVTVAQADADASAHTTVVVSPGARDGNSQTRDVSIDELLDLEQQAEFFVVLGQDDAAIELLVEHLRHTGGSSPLPYLKLLEIHRRRGDRSDYERMRARFNHRFNAYAPEWEVDLQSGLSLDGYPGVLPRLQQVWSQPLDSMAELESMLFRRSQGELFDLPAYREVLFLCGLARDLLDRQATDSGEVDVLLPLSAQCDFSSTSPTPFLDLGREARDAAEGGERRSTAPVDFDLSLESSRPASIFDPLEETPTHPRVR